MLKKVFCGMMLASSFLGAMEYRRELAFEKAQAWRKLNEHRLLLAAAEGEWSTVKYLLQTGVDINCVGEESAGEYCGMNPLACALRNGHTDLANYLEEQGAEGARVKG